MSKKSFVDSVRVGEPCTEKWERMRGNDRVRFCNHCAKDVKNLSAITRKEAARLVRSSGGNICIRYVKNPATDQPIFGGQLLQMTRRSPSLAAGIVSASLALSTITYAQSEPRVPNTTAPATASQRIDPENAEPDTADPDSSDDPTLGSIEGIILDTSGTPVPAITLMLVGAGENGNTEYTTTDSEGRYRFDELVADTYIIRISSSTGLMKKALRGLKLVEGERRFQNIYVRVVTSEDGEGGSGVGYGWGSGGAMIAVEYDLPLNKAVAADDLDEVRRLLSKGEKVNGKDKNYDDITPLFLAVENGNIAIVKLLLNHGSKVNARDNTKRTPLMFLDGDATPELVDVLLRAGAKVNARNENGQTVLLSTIASIDSDVLEALIKGGADVDAADEEGETALMKAAEENDLELVKTLVLAGAKIDEKDKSGESAWDKTSKPEIEEFLETYGAVADYNTIEVIIPTESEQDEGPVDEGEPEHQPRNSPSENRPG